MGPFSCCWCSGKTEDSSDIDRDKLKDDTNDIIQDDGDGDEAGRAAGQKKHRATKGKDQRIGAKLKNVTDQPPAEEHLLVHKRPRTMGKDTRKLIRVGMKQDRVCAMLEEKEIETILQTMEYFEFNPNQPVVTQGDVGNTFFVTHEGSLSVSMNGNVVNTLGRGKAFGSLALLYNCPRTASVSAKTKAGVWGANGDTFHKVLQENAKHHYAEHRKMLDSVKLFDGLPARQKDRIGDVLVVEVAEKGSRVVTQGEPCTAMYFVKTGELIVYVGAKIMQDGTTEGGKEIARLIPGDCFGERALLFNEPRGSTVVADARCELLCIGGEQLKEVLGNDLSACLERSFLLQGLRKSPLMSQLSPTQQAEIIKVMTITAYKPGDKIPAGLQFVIVVEGSITGKNNAEPVELVRNSWYENDALVSGGEKDKRSSASSANDALNTLDKKASTLSALIAGSEGARLGILTKEAMAAAYKALGMSVAGSAADAENYTRKMLLVKKVAIFRHLNMQQTDMLIQAFVTQKYKRGDMVIKQGEMGDKFFVIANGEVKIVRDGKPIRNLGKNTCFGERALLFHESRSASAEVASSEAELWSVAKKTFEAIISAAMKQELMKKIELQDQTVTMKDLKHVKLIGAGAAGVVRLVEHKTTKTRYALKRVKKADGVIPAEVKRECELLAENDHPFIMRLVKTFETGNSVYMLTELITGGELHAAIRVIPTVLSRAQAQFYTGSLVLVLEEIGDRNIVFRDLKPENVMLDQQGYLKLIDFGIAKKLEEGKCRTYTMIGTPHYMAPEVMRGHGYGTEVDIWSLGVMLFEFVCGYLPFADELDEPTEVCTAVLKDPLSFPSGYKDKAGRQLIQGMLTKQPKKRTGGGVYGFEDIKQNEFFKAGHSGEASVFNKIMGRELEPPVVPPAETYGDPEELAGIELSDRGELG
mmetsp:Transcript_1443/g.2483  ORF Transcript_1443/g.2483 Transcript_1443/m.2483 type:complete len:927 (+) Transcript_1443:66-2846(+)